jgi:hypothetical protein
MSGLPLLSSASAVNCPTPPALSTVWMEAPALQLASPQCASLRSPLLKS